MLLRTTRIGFFGTNESLFLSLCCVQVIIGNLTNYRSRNQHSVKKKIAEQTCLSFYPLAHRYSTPESTRTFQGAKLSVTHVSQSVCVCVSQSVTWLESLGENRCLLQMRAEAQTLSDFTMQPLLLQVQRGACVPPCCVTSYTLTM